MQINITLELNMKDTRSNLHRDQINGTDKNWMVLHYHQNHCHGSISISYCIGCSLQAFDRKDTFTFNSQIKWIIFVWFSRWSVHFVHRSTEIGKVSECHHFNSRKWLNSSFSRLLSLSLSYTQPEPPCNPGPCTNGVNGSISSNSFWPLLISLWKMHRKWLYSAIPSVRMDLPLPANYSRNWSITMPEQKDHILSPRSGGSSMNSAGRATEQTLTQRVIC